MSNLIFKLNSVPEDEAEDIRQLLHQAEIQFYETDSGRWGLGYAAIWCQDKDHLIRSQEIIENYQNERYQRVRSEHQAIEESGNQLSRLEFFLASPVKYSLLLIFSGLLAYFTVAPFFS